VLHRLVPGPLGATELRTIAAYVEALGGRLEIIADFGDQRLAFAEPGTVGDAADLGHRFL